MCLIVFWCPFKTSNTRKYAKSVLTWLNKMRERKNALSNCFVFAILPSAWILFSHFGILEIVWGGGNGHLWGGEWDNGVLLDVGLLVRVDEFQIFGAPKTGFPTPRTLIRSHFLIEFIIHVWTPWNFFWLRLVSKEDGLKSKNATTKNLTKNQNLQVIWNFGSNSSTPAAGWGWGWRGAGCWDWGRNENGANWTTSLVSLLLGLNPVEHKLSALYSSIYSFIYCLFIYLWRRCCWGGIMWAEIIAIFVFIYSFIVGWILRAE